MSIRVDVDAAKNEANFSITGRFDFEMHQDFRNALKEAGPNLDKYIVDMGAVEDMDSSALGMLLLLRESAGGDAGSIQLIRCRPDIIDILKMANFQTIFDIS